MSKTIDVRPGDTWTLVDDGGMFQYRNKQWRGIYADTREDEMYWRGPQDRLACEVDIPSDHAIGMLKSWGYTLTPAAKPEDKPDDVPVASELWGRIHIGSGKIRVYASKAFAEKAQAGCKDPYWVVMQEPLVRIRSVDEEARFLAHHANERLDQHVNRLAEAHTRIDALESRLAAVTESAASARQIADNVSDRVDELLERVQALEKPADKPAARVVKAPKRVGGEWVNQTKRDTQWIAALTEAGITIADEGSKDE